MAVYVDDAMIQFGRMKMSHMIADTTNELLAMADAVGVQRKWIQNAGTYREHFDVCASKRELAIANGAQAVSQRKIGEILNSRRKSQRP